MFRVRRLETRMAGSALRKTTEKNETETRNLLHTIDQLRPETLTLGCSSANPEQHGRLDSVYGGVSSRQSILGRVIMEVESRIPEKLFFRIGEVCELIKVQPHVLRYWETE